MNRKTKLNKSNSKNKYNFFLQSYQKFYLLSLPSISLSLRSIFKLILVLSSLDYHEKREASLSRRSRSGADGDRVGGSSLRVISVAQSRCKLAPDDRNVSETLSCWINSECPSTLYLVPEHASTRISGHSCSRASIKARVPHRPTRQVGEEKMSVFKNEERNKKLVNGKPVISAHIFRLINK